MLGQGVVGRVNLVLLGQIVAVGVSFSTQRDEFDPVLTREHGTGQLPAPEIQPQRWETADLQTRITPRRETDVQDDFLPGGVGVTYDAVQFGAIVAFASEPFERPLDR